MKKFFLFALTAIMSLFIASCSEDVMPAGQSEGMVDVSYSINTQSQTNTRATHDGDGIASSVNRYICEVWHLNGENSTLYKRVENVVDAGTTSTSFNLRLVASQNYKVLFWADHATVSGTTATDLYYETNAADATKGLKEVAIKTPYSGNKDDMDAFCGTDDITNLKGTQNYTVELKRPFAQLNVITTDIKDIQASSMAANMEPDKVTLTVNAPTKFNVFTGETSENANIEYTADVYYTAEKNKKENGDVAYSYCTLAMSYIFAPADQKAVETVKLAAIKGDKTLTSPEFANIPLQRNFRTNIIGDLLTDGVNYTVNVVPNWTEPENEVHWTKVATVDKIADAFAAGATNVEVLEAPTTDVSIEIPKKHEANNQVSVGIKLPETTAQITFKYKTEGTLNAPANINIEVKNASNNVEINCPDSHVTLNGGVYQNVNASTSSTSLIIEKGVTISGTLTVTEGGVEIHGSVATLAVTASGKTVVFRTCEGLSENVYNVVKNYIDPDYVAVKIGTTYDIYKPDARKSGYRTNGNSAPLPTDLECNGNVWNVTAANAQYVLDGAYGPIDGKAINFTENITEKLVLGRPTKFEGSNTVYRHGSFSNAPLSYEDFIAYKTQSGWTEYSYYNRAISNVTFTANAGVTVAGFTACGGSHVYGTTTAPVYDYVRDNGTWCPDANNGYYVYVELKNFKFDGLTFNGGTAIDTSSDKTVFDGFEFNQCTFNINNTGSGNQAIHYYSEGNQGNVKNLTVKNCIFNSAYQAIYTAKVVNITIEGNTVTTTGHNAFAIQNSNNTDPGLGNIIIKNNTITGCGDRAIRFNYVNAPSNITITGNTASYGNGTTASNEEAIKATSIAAGVTINVDNNDWKNFKAPANPEFLPVVAQIGNTKYPTLTAALTAVQAGETIEIVKAGTYTVPTISKNITVKGAVDGVVFNCAGSGSIASIPNGCTFENVTFNMGTNDYHGFQHAGTINMNGCVINGKFFSYGEMNFTGCTFNQEATDYNMWCYGQDLTYMNCTFNSKGKFLNVYNEGNGNWKITATNCKFNSDTKNKAAFNIKASCGDTNLGWEVRINNCTVGDTSKFPAASGDATSTLFVGSPLWQVDDRTQSSLQADIVRVYVDGEKVY